MAQVASIELIEKKRKEFEGTGALPPGATNKQVVDFINQQQAGLAAIGGPRAQELVAPDTEALAREQAQTLEAEKIGLERERRALEAAQAAEKTKAEGRRERIRGDILAGQELGKELIPTGSLGRVDEGAIRTDISSDVQEILRRRREGLDTGLSTGEQNIQRDRAGQEINRAVETQRRSLQALQSRLGVRGGTAAAQQVQTLQSGIQARGEFERDLFLENERIKRENLDKFEGAVSRAEQDQLGRQLAQIDLQKFNLQQAAQERFGQVGASLGFAQFSQAEIAAEKGAAAQVAAARAQGGGGGGVTVICTELHRQGYLSNDIMEKDRNFGIHIRKTDPAVYAGYIMWAPTVVKIMKKSKLFTKTISLLAVPWATYMAGGDSKLGKFVMNVGSYLCKKLFQIKNSLSKKGDIHG